MKAKRTIKVSEVVTIANGILKRSVCDPKIREGVSIMLGAILDETHNYNGFMFLRDVDVPAKELPGIIFDPSPDHNHVYPDGTRRHYYCKTA